MALPIEGHAMTGAERELLLAGLPKTGKTSFLALLYIAISKSRARDLTLGHFRDDHTYLNEIAQRLMQCEEAVHTEVDEGRELLLSLITGPDREEVTLRVPDLSGETWEHVASDREWSLDMEDQVRRSEGIIIFVHSTKIDAHPSIASVDAAAKALGATDGKATDTKKARPDLPPTQVSVIDALQLVCEERSRRPSRAAIVVSAWDLVKDVTPNEWLERECPLVAQYADANAGWLHLATFGISAQGGKFNTKSSREKLSKSDALERAAIVDGDGTEANVADPVLWILRTDGTS
jgi:Double-GTPase 1